MYIFKVIHVGVMYCVFSQPPFLTIQIFFYSSVSNTVYTVYTVIRIYSKQKNLQIWFLSVCLVILIGNLNYNLKKATV